MPAKNIITSIQAFHDELAAIRQDIHAHPELGFEELRTAALVAGRPEKLGYTVHRNGTGTRGALSFMLQECPGAYFRLGQGGAESGRVLHNASFDFNDAIIPAGSAMFCRLVERAMPLSYE